MEDSMSELETLRAENRQLKAELAEERECATAELILGRIKRARLDDAIQTLEWVERQAGSKRYDVVLTLIELRLAALRKEREKL
jgi:hypothetical protein